MRDIKYNSRDFESILTNLKNYIKLYFSNSYGDFTPTSTGSMLMELMAYVGDVMSFYQDSQYNEIFNPNEKKSAIRLLKLFGGKYKGKTQSNLNATLLVLVPSAVIGGEVQPDESYLPVIRRGMLCGTDDNKQFTSIEDVDFADATNREITVYSADSNGVPTYYAVKKTVKVISGNISSFSYTVEDPVAFLKIPLPSDRNIIEIISVVDSDGEEWREVEYLAQDSVFLSEKNKNESTKYQVPLLLRMEKIQKRFITDVDKDNVTSLIFGNSRGTLDSGVIFPNPSQFMVNNLSDNIGFFSFNSDNLLSSGSLGLSPANTTLTITYLYGGGSEYNISSGQLNTILTRDIIFRTPISSLVPIKYQNVVSSLTVYNYEQAKDGIDEMDIEVMKQLIPMFYASQKRAVTLEDYYAILYSMPAKFGGIYRALAMNDDEDPLSVALYVLTRDLNKNLSVCSDELKNNIKVFLSRYKMITDNVNIYDGDIVNFGIEYEIIVNDGYNIDEVKERINQYLYNYYMSNPFDFGQNIYVTKVVKMIDDIEGVLTVSNIIFKNLTGSNYSNSRFNFKTNNINNVISPGYNQIFELKYSTDIIGKVRYF